MFKIFTFALLAMSADAFAPSPRPPVRSIALHAKVANVGLFSPIVKGAEALLGRDELTKLRGKVIAEHSKVIANFVDTSESPFGRIALKRLFEAADADGNGTLDKEEVRAALNALGFEWLGDESKVSELVARSDLDMNEVIDFEEFCQAAPKTLRTNLIKLAKQNGNDLGFLV